MNNLISVVVVGTCCVFGFSSNSIANPLNANSFAPLTLLGQPNTEIPLANYEGSGLNQWYLVPNIGINLIDSWHGVGSDDGFSFGLTLGVRISNNFKIEFSVSKLENDLDPITHTVGSDTLTLTNGEIEQIPLLVHFLWNASDFDDGISPYFGVSFGAIRGDIALDGSDTGVVNGTTWSTTFNDTDWHFAYGFRAGIGIDLDPSTYATFEYRFLQYEFLDEDINNNTFSAGVTWRF